MMRLAIFAFILAMFSAVLEAANQDSLFAVANNLYAEENYEAAAETYYEILKTGVTSPELFFNLGNAWFRSNRLGNARLYYEKALLLSPRDKAIKANLAYTESLLIDKFEEVPVFFLREWIISLRKSMAPKTWSVLSLGIFFVSFVLLVIFLFAKRMTVKKMVFYPGVTLFFLSIICLFFSFSASKFLRNSGTAILTVPSGIVKSAPRESGKDLFIIHEGAKVWLENKTGDWQEIRISDGRIGWLPSASIEKI